MMGDQGHLDIKRRVIDELEAENERLRMRVRTLEADLEEQKRRTR
jgi:hypothetical protein